MITAAANFNQEELNDLSDYFYGAPIGLHITGPDGVITRTNLAELELLGYRENADEYIGRHLAEFHSDSEEVENLLEKLIEGELVTEFEASLVCRDGKQQKVLLYANARTENGNFRGVRCLTFPHPDDLRPDIAEVGALKDESVESRQQDLTTEKRSEVYSELRDFFDNAPVNMHIVGGDGLIKHANNSEILSMGYESGTYIGEHIANFHANQGVIDGMLEDLVGGTPLINFDATLYHKNGNKLPVMIYSNSRMRDGSFVNTRCFTVPVPKVRKESSEQAVKFLWPRNEDFGFTLPGRQETETQTKPNPMTLALKYIASRKRPEESLSFLAQVSRILGTKQPFEAMLKDVLKLSVPFLADFASVNLTDDLSVSACATSLQERSYSIAQFIAGSPDEKFSAQSVQRSGDVTVCFDVPGEYDAQDKQASRLLDLGIRSLIIVPLTIRGQNVGALTLLRENQSSRRNFGLADQALAQELARRFSFAVEIERLSGRA